MIHLVQFLLPVLFCFVRDTDAFHPNGHMMVAAVAQESLKNSLKTDTLDKVNKLISMQASTYPDYATFIESAAWLDFIRTKTDRFTKWHFTSNMIHGDSTECKEPPMKEDIMWALPREIAFIKSQSSLDYKKRFNYTKFYIDEKMPEIAIRFVLHLMGDLHEPLHVSDFCSETFPHGDQGGNLFKVNYNGTIHNLHEIVDAMGFQYTYEIPVDVPTKILENHALINAKNLIRTFPPSSFQEFDPSDVFGFEKWVEEGYHIAKTQIYTIKPGETCDENYINTIRDMTNKRVLLAGYRLAIILDHIF